MFRIPDVPWLSGLILVVGVIAFIVALVQIYFIKDGEDEDGGNKK